MSINIKFHKEAFEALSYVIVTCTEGGCYTRDDFKKWTTYKHGNTPEGFRAEVTVYPSPDALGDDATEADLAPVRLTPEEFAKRLLPLLVAEKTPTHLRADIANILFAGEYGDGDVIRDGALMQLAIYGDVVFG